jgi:hypothetical protein
MNHWEIAARANRTEHMPQEGATTLGFWLDIQNGMNGARLYASNSNSDTRSNPPALHCGSNNKKWDVLSDA